MKKGALKNTFSRVNGDKLVEMPTKCIAKKGDARLRKNLQQIFAALPFATPAERGPLRYTPLASQKNSRKGIFQNSQKIFRFKNEQEWIQAFVDQVTASAVKSVRERDVFRMGLSGGETPKPLYQTLSQVKDFPWSKTELSLVDERDVPLDDPRSNYRMIREQLIDRLSSLKNTFSRVNGDKLAHDLLLLGIGSDGHTASLFPNSPALQVEDQWVVKTEPAGEPFVSRYTLTYPALMSAREIIFLLRGKEKEAVLEKVQESDSSDPSCPAARLFHLPQTKVFYCEE